MTSSALYFRVHPTYFAEGVGGHIWEVSSWKVWTSAVRVGDSEGTQLPGHTKQETLESAPTVDKVGD